MWTIEQLIGAGLFFAQEMDIPASAEIRLLPAKAVAGGQHVKLYKFGDASKDESPIGGTVEADVVLVQRIGHPKIPGTLGYAYSHPLNILAIILDG